jgi:hypothetical protein
MTGGLDENCGAVGWAMTPSGMPGVLNDAVSIYFLDAKLVRAFVALWCAGYKVEATKGRQIRSKSLAASPSAQTSHD